MKILHYSLGFPPYRTGGLTKFCLDIMHEQIRIGNDVGLLWPGEMKLIGNTVSVRNRGKHQGIQSWEIINSLPISYDEGIIDIKAFTKPTDRKVFIDFLKWLHPDVIHIHTLMGLHKEFFEATKELNIRTVFTTHDFFPICPKVTMFRDNKICSTVNSCIECPKCNLTALSSKKILLLQSPLYRVLKDSCISKRLRKHHRDQYLSGCSGNTIESIKKPENSSYDYHNLREYYRSIISLVDVIHYNSSVTKNVYETFFKHNNSKIISISHSHIKDNRKIKQFGNELRLTYLGPPGGGKGFFRLKAALDKLWLKNKHFSLNIFFKPLEESPYMKVHGRYTYSDLESIFEETDILIAPSIWYETFGYTVLEALSFGVPVIVSSTVGAKDIIPAGCGIVLEDMNEVNLEETISDLTAEELSRMNKNILELAIISEVAEMNDEIMKSCY